ncbi:uncharacterized protein (DUF58 family) [Sphingomonas sp. SORGH_AS 950]|uniref:DUF58 domain-containing protein n=1 Tax=Sphingomonas sp. SORGH_AS_0950 TaxID=3041792 RepID=UPI002780745F|nr:DUF58 domain-containing protein [Sphingomonas sp. SORGH_AS_0950]MDQ1155843.1 uncharacterized protein (DUF58 family) [Sphingomonas sp. SORGH_AS_0950]
MNLSSAPGFDELFDPVFLDRVNTLTLRIAAAQKGGRLADQRTSARGQGSDFADFKPYVAGDDLRAIDWNIYRRLGKAFVRVFEERQDLPVYILLDVSRSMFVESPPRIGPAMRTVLALAAVALGQQDAVSLMTVSDDMSTAMKSVSGKGGIARVAHTLADQVALGRSALAGAVARLASMRLRRGLVILVSDFFDDDGLEGVLAGLEALPHRLLLVQMVRASDADPTLLADLDGDVVIEDGEREGAGMTVTPELIARYRAAYRDFTDRLDAFARRRGATLVRMDADGDVLDQLVPVLTAGSVLP